MRACYARLCGWAVEGRDFTIELRRRKSRVLVMAPHGGRIEPGAGRLAGAVAGDRFSLYRFSGRLARDNHRLHMPSHLFDEPRALAALKQADVVVAIHGHRDSRAAFVMVGGLDKLGRQAVASGVKRAGFQVRCPVPGMAGEHPDNICNRGRSGKGVQLEVSAALRRMLAADPALSERLARAIQFPLNSFLMARPMVSME